MFKLAIIGSGPSGLSAAADAAELRHSVDIYRARCDPDCRLFGTDQCVLELSDGIWAHIKVSPLWCCFFLASLAVSQLSRILRRNMATLGGTAFTLLFIAPSLLLFHGFFIWASNGMLELWPPILFLDTALFVPALILHRLAKRQRDSVVSGQTSPISWRPATDILSGITSDTRYSWRGR